MATNYEVVIEVNSINNKKIRANELKILELNEKELSFTFGENNVNAKKRYFKDLKTLKEEFKKVQEIKEKLEKEENEKRSRISSGMRRTGLNEEDK